MGVLPWTALHQLLPPRSRRTTTAGAGEGNRTLVVSLEGFCSTIELHPPCTAIPFNRLRSTAHTAARNGVTNGIAGRPGSSNKPTGPCRDIIQRHQQHIHPEHELRCFNASLSRSAPDLESARGTQDTLLQRCCETRPFRSGNRSRKFWWRGKDSNLRRLSQQIYSLPPLTAREPLRTKPAIMGGKPLDVNESAWKMPEPGCHGPAGKFGRAFSGQAGHGASRCTSPEWVAGWFLLE